MRIVELDSYMRAHVLEDGKFLCRHFADCRASRREHTFYEGQLSHVGKHYDLEIDRKPVRIVVVGQEYGHDDARVSLVARSEMIMGFARQAFRSRNPHMKGTTLTLRLLFGREPGLDSAGEMLNGGVHMFEVFALVNYLLCSALKAEQAGIGTKFSGGGRGCSSPTMQHNCSQHFVKTLEILEPTVIVIQGKGTRTWLAQALGIAQKGQVLEKVTIGSNVVDLVSLYHPSAREPLRYCSPESKYLREVVRPALRKVCPLPG